MNPIRMAILAALTLAWSNVQVFATPVPGAFFSGSMATAFFDASTGNFIQKGINPITGGSVTIGGSTTTGSAHALASITTDLAAPAISADVSAGGGDLFHPSTALVRSYQLDYFFLVAGPAGAATVPVHIAASGTAGATGDGIAQDSLRVLPQFGRVNSVASPNARDWTLNTDFIASIDQIYQVEMFINIGISNGNGTASASVDPIFTIDLPLADAAQFQFFFSDGVGNGNPTTATPLPATLPLFASGLGAIGLLGWRRKRKIAHRINPALVSRLSF
jgi:hypothetical protein